MICLQISKDPTGQIIRKETNWPPIKREKANYSNLGRNCFDLATEACSVHSSLI